MKNIINFAKKYKLYILASLLVIFFFRSCKNSTETKRANRLVEEKVEQIDSLNLVIKQKQQKLDSVPELMRIEKMNIHLEYDSWISEKDRSQQLMELHKIVKDNVKQLQK